jgi:hypothetical protein
METLQTIQQLAPATIVASVTLPWIAAALLHVFSAASRSAHDDQWNLRAGAAVRWAGAPLAPARVRENTVVDFSAHRNSRSSDAATVPLSEFYPHAA